MYKVLIAEDEMFVRLGIKMSVDWAKMGMEVVADVENGQEALEVYEALKPDIIITDIKMPVMDGIALIKRIREKDERTRFVILSCLEEFDIVREAISLGVSDYVLKLTMRQEDMESVLGKAKKELAAFDRSRKQEKDGSLHGKAFQDSLRNYLYYGLDMVGEYRKQIDEKYADSGKKIRMVILDIDLYLESRKLFDDSYGSILDSAVDNILSELLAGENHILLPEGNGRTVLILEEEDDEELSPHMEELLETIRSSMKQYVKSTVSLGISENGDGYEDFYELYHQCSVALEKKFFYGLNRNYLFPCQSQEEGKKVIRRKMERLIRRMQKDEAAVKCLEEACESFCQHENPVTIRLYFEYAVNTEMCRILPEGQTRYQIAESYMNKVKESKTFDEVLEIYVSCMQYLQEKSSEEGQLSRQVKDILYYISQHYGEEITLDQIAQVVELSRTYVCGLFKKEMGINLTNYIMNYRIDKAKELFRNTNLRSYEVAEKVGFYDESYFSRTFKKLTGESPNSYKKGIRKE